MPVENMVMDDENRNVPAKCLKRQYRKEMIARRAALSPEEQLGKSRAIVRRLIDTDYYRSAQVIMSYCGVRGEVSLSLLEESALRDGKRLVFPVCCDAEHMEAFEPVGADGFASGMYGIREPDVNTALRISPEDIDLVLCPCTAFDRTGGRIGMGKGYYDRYVMRCSRARVIAVAYDFQEVPVFETEPWDLRMEAVITEMRSIII